MQDFQNATLDLLHIHSISFWKEQPWSYSG